MKIVTLGSALQHIYLLDHDDFAPTCLKNMCTLGQIKIGTKVDIDRISFEVGGGGTNSAVSFARHGHEVVFLGNVGNDPAGVAVKNLLSDEGVDISYITHTTKAKTGLSVILLDTKSGERTILTYRGASARFDNLSEDDLATVKPDWMYVSSLRGDMQTLERFFKKAKSMNCKIMFNPGELEIAEHRKLINLFKYTDILLVNEHEAHEIVEGDVLAELLSHLSNYVPCAIITAGATGGIAKSSNGKKSEVYRFGLYEDIKVKDTTGAGDAFGSGFLAHFASGHTFEESLIFASANSTSVVSELGAKAGILDGTEDIHPMPIQKLE